VDGSASSCSTGRLAARRLGERGRRSSSRWPPPALSTPASTARRSSSSRPWGSRSGRALSASGCRRAA